MTGKNKDPQHWNEDIWAISGGEFQLQILPSLFHQQKHSFLPAQRKLASSSLSQCEDLQGTVDFS